MHSLDQFELSSSIVIDSPHSQLGIDTIYNPVQPLQLAASLHQSSDAADVARPPGHRAQVAQTRRLDVRVQKTEGDPRQRVPHADGVDLLIGDPGDNGEKHCSD